MTAQRPPTWLITLLRPWLEDFLVRVGRALAAGDQVTSWWRGAAHNASVGGHARSQHLLGLALDLAPRDGLIERLRAQALVAIDEGSHVHVQLSPAGKWDWIVHLLRPWL